MKNIEYFYPGFTKKAITFTIDDGNMKYDRIFLDILEPAGIKGTFNLCSHIHEGREAETLEFYRNYGIANHCKYHPLVNYDGEKFVISDDEFDEKTADSRFLYRVKGKDAFFWQMQPNGWREMVFEDDYICFIQDGLSELNAIFGEGQVVDYVWPYHEPKNAKVRDFVKQTHRSARKTGLTRDTEGFSLPRDRYAWSYNTDCNELLALMEKYEAYPDDGELKFFAIGVHSIDFERADKWDDLRIFARKYGNRPEVFWYASVGEIFDYEDAVNALEINGCAIKNTSQLPVYIGIDGERRVLNPGDTINI